MGKALYFIAFNGIFFSAFECGALYSHIAQNPADYAVRPRERILQRYEYQEVGIVWGFLRGWLLH